MITKNYYGLRATGKGQLAKSKKEIETIFRAGADFETGIDNGFRFCSIADIPKGNTVILRFGQDRKTCAVKV